MNNTLKKRYDIIKKIEKKKVYKKNNILLYNVIIIKGIKRY